LTEQRLCERLAVSGVVVSKSRVGQLLRKMGIRRPKKSLHALERDSAPNLQRRQELLQQIGQIAPEKRIFLDERGVTTQMTRQWGCAPKGQRIAEATPQGRWKVLTTLGAMSLCGMEVVMPIESATEGEVFLNYLELVLCPKLKAGDVVIMDNLPVHKVAGNTRPD
jgi:DDE superfamily endonuclease